MTSRKFPIAQILLVSLAPFASIETARAQVASGAPYALEQTVIAAGGGASSSAAGGVFTIEGTIGQSVAGAAQSGNAAFTIKSGFWAVPNLQMPTAALVTVGGRVTTASGRGIRNVIVKITGADGATRAARTTAFGYYRFADVPAGETYIFSLSAKRFTFGESARVLQINEDTNDINFTAVIDAQLERR